MASRLQMLHQRIRSGVRPHLSTGYTLQERRGSPWDSWRVRARASQFGGLSLLGLLLAACARGSDGAPPSASGAESAAQTVVVLPGISVLLRDSVHLIAGKRLGLLTNQTGIDETGRSDIDLLTEDQRVVQSGARLVALFSPEHGIRGTEDRRFIESGRDERTGLPIHSLYGATTLAPPDSTLRELDVLVFDLQDIGTRTWTYVGNLVYALRAVKRNDRSMIVLDRPNPISGVHRDGPMLDSAIANSEEHSAARPARPYALYPFPLRHGMTMGEMALFYNTVLGIDAELRVVPMSGWTRSMWFDDTALPWVKPSPNMPSLTSALLYPALVAFEGSNMSVGRGTDEAFQRIGAPWLPAGDAARMLEELNIPGVRFEAEMFTPRSPTDNKYADRSIPGVRIHVIHRDSVQAGLLGAALLWAVDSLSVDSLRINESTFDLRFGSRAAREALRRGEDPRSVISRVSPEVEAFERSAARFILYR